MWILSEYKKPHVGRLVVALIEGCIEHLYCIIMELVRKTEHERKRV